MIVFDLKCQHDHVFESWFSNSEAYAKQAESKLIECPYCGDTEITKALMAPRLAGAKKNKSVNQSDSSPASEETASVPAVHQAKGGRKALQALRRHIEESFDYVGDRFAEEARRQHWGESEARNIYGETSDADAKALTEEGIEVHRVPWLPKQDH